MYKGKYKSHLGITRTEYGRRVAYYVPKRGRIRIWNLWRIKKK